MMNETTVIYNLLSERYHELVDSKTRDEKVFQLISDMYENYKRKVLQGPESTKSWQQQFLDMVAKYKEGQLFEINAWIEGDWNANPKFRKEHPLVQIQAKAQLEFECAELIANFNYAITGKLP